MKVQFTRTAMYSPPVDGMLMPAAVTVDQLVKSSMTDGTETPVECLTELLFVLLNQLSKSLALVGYAPYWLVEPVPPLTDQISYCTCP